MTRKLETSRVGERRTVSFRSGAGLISRLGAEQLRDEVTAIVELVKNAYDADCTVCKVEIDPEKHIDIWDNGNGMDYRDIEDKWCLLATENKLENKRSPKFKRRRLGHKGIGRFACEKLGGLLRLRTRDDPHSKFLKTDFDWEALDPGRYLEEYRFPVHVSTPRLGDPAGTGTVLGIRNLRTKWTRARVRTLRGQLCTLVDPEADVDEFRIVLETPWDELKGELKNSIVGKETHLLEFVLDSSGKEQVEIRTDQESTFEHQELNMDTLAFGPIRGKLCYFGEGLKKAERGRGGSPEEDWNMGVRISRDGWRIRPYGEPGPQGDWLQIYQRRYVGGSRFRLKPHYLMGVVLITKDNNPELRDTSSREGLDENEAYKDLVDYVKSMISRLNTAVRSEEIKRERRHASKRYKDALDTITKGLNSVRSDIYLDEVGRADERVRTKIRRERVITTTSVRNWHWECLDCGDGWKVPLEKQPTHCREYSVRRDGSPTYKPGCGSPNIQRKENQPGVESSVERNNGDAWKDFVKGEAAYISGVQVRPYIDWNMGPRDEEAEVRHDDRLLAFNGNHSSFVAADNLDGKKVSKDSEVSELLRETAALTTHLINAAALAWGTWHYEKTGDFEDYRVRVAGVKQACLQALPEGIRRSLEILEKEKEKEPCA